VLRSEKFYFLDGRKGKGRGEEEDEQGERRGGGITFVPIITITE
jgi:hypothetical protein